MLTNRPQAGLILFTLVGSLAAPLIAVAQQPDVSDVSGNNEESGMHRVIGWAESQLKEMDAAITTLETNAKKLSGEARERADAELEKLRALREQYQQEISSGLASAGEKARTDLESFSNSLESSWSDFEAGLKNYYDQVSADAQTRLAVFQAMAEAQRAAFQQRIDELDQSAVNATDKVKADIAKRKSELEQALHDERDRLDRLGKATNAAWSQMVQRLRDARDTFQKTYEGN